MTTASLTRWLDDPPTSSLHVAGGSSDLRRREAWNEVPYRSLVERVWRAVDVLERQGCGPDDLVAIGVPVGSTFVASFFAALVVGGTPSVFAPPGLLGRTANYAALLHDYFRAARPAFAICEEQAISVVEGALAAADVACTVLDLSGGHALPVNRAGSGDRGDTAFVQFTSGSTSAPKAIAISWDALESNLASIRAWLDLDEHDVMSSWLPMYHDMGLVGTLLATISAGASGYYLRPEQFLRDPGRWLVTLGHFGGTYSAVPVFALRQVLQRVRPDDIDGLDFSHVRGIGVGAERIDHAAMKEFEDLLATRGLRRGLLSPAYGLAEATLSVTGRRQGGSLTAVQVERGGELRFGTKVALVDRVNVDGQELVGEGWVVSSGHAVPGVEVRIGGANHEELADRTLGQVLVRSRAIGRSYRGPGSTDALETTEDGLYPTGDLGFLLDGELFVIGRMGDGLKVKGSMVFPEDVEVQLRGVTGVDPTRVTVVLGERLAGPTARVLIEARTVPDTWLEEAHKVVIAVLPGAVDVGFLRCRPGFVERTSSGKPRRRATWQRLASAPDGVVTLSVLDGLRAESAKG